MYRYGDPGWLAKFQQDYSRRCPASRNYLENNRVRGRDDRATRCTKNGHWVGQNQQVLRSAEGDPESNALVLLNVGWT